MNMPIDPLARSVVQTINDAGYDAYFAGGCVRDLCMGITPHDWDITTSALPQQIMDLFPGSIPTGIKHGTITVRVKDSSFEVTTFRTEGPYLDSRHPSSVSFVSSVEEDLARRDFTINAMAYHPIKGLIDLFGGREDIRRRRLRCVGDAACRFKEDALRMMRLVRFAVTLDFTPDPQAIHAARLCAPRLFLVSAERLLSELKKMLCASSCLRLSLLDRCGLTPALFPEFSPGHLRSMIPLLQLLPAQFFLRMTGLLHGMNPAQAQDSLRRLKVDNQTIRQVQLFLSHSSLPLSPQPYPLKLAMLQIEPSLFPLFLQYRQAIALWQNDHELCSQFQAIIECFSKVIANGDPLTLHDLAINGRDLEALGIPGGKQIGILLQYLLHAVLKDPSLNTREKLINLAKSYVFS